MSVVFLKNRDDNCMENDLDEGEPSGMSKDGKDYDKYSRDTPTDSPSMSSKADTPIPEAGGSHDDGYMDDEKTQWPSVVDLNTRLRRVISSYQRSVKKEETKTFQKAKMLQECDLGNHSGATIEPPLNMQSWDLQQLAMYLLVRWRNF